jgi:low affinity Fe/Cu permease
VDNNLLNCSLEIVAKFVSSAATIVAVLGIYLVRAISPKLSPALITPTLCRVGN